MKERKYKTFVGDFETTVYQGQEYTEVWASGLVELFTEDVFIHHSIDETFNYIRSIKNQNILVYYHNLKFDGSFILHYFLTKTDFKQAYELETDGEHSRYKWIETKYMKNNTFKYQISDRGMWYNIILKVDNRLIEFRDSLKLLPFSVAQISKHFATKHKKLDMQYTGFRYSGCEITEKEREYLANDLLVVKEVLEMMYLQGHTKLTIGACCMSDFKKTIGGDLFSNMFPDLYELPLKESLFGSKNVDEYIRKSYKGGWCYLVEGKSNKKIKNGHTLDVNSLYPSMMSSESGNYFPVSFPTFFTGDIPQFIKEDKEHKYYYFVRIRTRFYIKKGYLPFIQIKGNFLYNGNECLKSSDTYNPKSKKYTKTSIDFDGKEVLNKVTLTLTMSDFELIKQHYDLIDLEILDGCYFRTEIGLFDVYINKYKLKKINAKTKGERTEAKLFLNNIYGKFSTSKESSFKIVYLKEDNSLGYILQDEYDKKVGYIAVGSAITSYARCFTIKAAQQNYYGDDKQGFIYSDTDSIHLDLPFDKIKGVEISATDFCKWKHESEWEYGLFVRQKTYVEKIIKEDEKDVEPYFNLKCAGLPQKCKNLFLKSVELATMNIDDKKEYIENDKDLKKLTDTEKEYVMTPRKIEDFRIGLEVPSKLRPKNINGGILLVESTYKMH